MYVGSLDVDAGEPVASADIGHRCASGLREWPPVLSARRHADGTTIRRSPPGAPGRAGARGPGRPDHVVLHRSVFGVWRRCSRLSDRIGSCAPSSSPGLTGRGRTWARSDRQERTGGLCCRRMARARVAKDAPYNVPGDLWMLDFASGRLTRFTFKKDVYSPAVWSPDGARIAYSAGRLGDTIYEKAASGLGDEQVLFKEPGLRHFPTSWSRDGRFLLYHTENAPRTRDTTCGHCPSATASPI